MQRYQSLLRTHFADWLEQPVTALRGSAFAQHCHTFVQTKGAALVELGRGLIGALVKYLNALYELALSNPFERLAGAGLMSKRTQPRARRLQEEGLSAWKKAVDTLPSQVGDYLMLLALTGLRRAEARNIKVRDIDWTARLLCVPDTKTNVPHSLPMTVPVVELLQRRVLGLHAEDEIFAAVSAEHAAEMAIRAGAPKFMLHDLRKMLATVGKRQGHSDAVLRKILNHKAKKADTLHRHYVSLQAQDVYDPLAEIQNELLGKMI